MNMNASVLNSSFSEVLEWKKRSLQYSDVANAAKRARYEYYYVLESESSVSSDDRTESIHSIQDKETDFVADTSDTCTKSDVSDYDMQVEFEIASSSCGEEKFFQENSSSDGNDAMMVAGAVAVSMKDSELWVTDAEDSDTTSTVIGDTQYMDNQMCRICKIRATLNCFTICSHCYQIRKNLYPPRPRRLRHKKLKNNLNSASSLTAQSCLSGPSQDSGVCSALPSDWDKIIVPQNLLEKNSSESGQPTAGTSSGSTESVASCSQTTQSAAGSSAETLRSELVNDCVLNWTKSTQELCIMCNEMPKDGIFVHSTGGHLCSCYKCALKFFGKSRRCAVCNCRALNVIKAYVL